MFKNPLIVLTGGPGGGKSVLMRELWEEGLPARRWILVPEAAPLLFAAGLDARERGFQKAVVRLQMALEESCSEAAQPSQVLLCHRGTLDPLAYWMRNGWEASDFFSYTNTQAEDHHRRYVGVLHLQSAALGAEAHYTRFPKAHRPETPDEAAEIDRFCAFAWRAHPRYASIENLGRTWTEKARVARKVITHWIDQLGWSEP